MTDPAAKSRVKDFESPNRLKNRYRRILRFASLALAQTWWYELVLPKFGLKNFVARGRVARIKKLARRFRVLALDLGGLIIKAGQFASSRLDVLPETITAELESLQDEVSPAPLASIRAQIEQELGLSLEVAFAEFAETPIAAASLGQAYRAKLAPTLAADEHFEDVVVKVLRPGIEQVVEVDLKALRKVGQWLSRIRLVSRRADAPALVEEFAEVSLHEIDYYFEAGNLERFKTNFEADSRVTAPEVVWERSSRRVLTLSDVTAIKINDVEALQRSGEEPDGAELARAAAHPIPHREAGEPLLGDGNFIELATFAGDSDRMGRKRKARLLPAQGGFNLAVPRFGRAARLRSHQDEGGAEALTKRIKDAIDAVGVRVIDEVHAQGVLRGAEGIGHKLRA